MIMRKLLWLTGFAFSILFIGTGITIWGLLGNKPMVVAIVGAILVLIGLVAGLLQIDPVREAWTVLWSSLLPFSLTAQIPPPDPSVLSRPPSRREGLAILAMVGTSLLLGTGFAVSNLLPDGKLNLVTIAVRRKARTATSVSTEDATATATLAASPTATLQSTQSVPAQPTENVAATVTPQTTLPLVTESSKGIFYTFADSTQISGWRPSDFTLNGDSVQWEGQKGYTAKGALKVNANLWGAANPARPSSDVYTHTEVLVYFRSSAVYDFSGKNVSCWIYVPQTSAADNVYVTLVLKSLYKNIKYVDQYQGKIYINSNLDQWFQLTTIVGKPDMSNVGSIDPNFDPKQIAAFGVLIKAEEGISTFAGKNVQFYLDDCTIS